MMDSADSQTLTVDVTVVQTLAAANGLNLAAERAADLVPALRTILAADAQLTELNLDAYAAAGLPWESRQAKESR